MSSSTEPAPRRSEGSRIPVDVRRRVLCIVAATPGREGDTMLRGIGFALVCTAAGMCGPAAFAQDYRIERIASGLNQPTYITQAPGDPANILYFTERTSNTLAGF